MLVIASPAFGLLPNFNPGLVLLQDRVGTAAVIVSSYLSAAASGIQGFTKCWESMGRSCYQV
jgi:hypothetical protein